MVYSKEILTKLRNKACAYGRSQVSRRRNCRTQLNAKRQEKERALSLSHYNVVLYATLPAYNIEATKA